MANNDSTLADPDEAGAYEDWIEVYNPGASSVDMSGMYLTDDLGSLTKLKKLILNETVISDVGLAHLQKLGQLEELGLWKTKVIGSGLKHLASLKHLQILALGYTQTSDVDLALLGGLEQLRELNLVNTRITDAGMEVVGGFGELRTLHLSNTAITDAGLAHVSRLAKLENLILDFTKIHGEGLAQLKGMTSLKQLSLWNTLITDDALPHVQPLTGLELLNVANTPVTDVGLERIENLVHLKELYLSGTRVTDAGLLRLSKMTDLERLGLLRLAGVTDKGLPHLEGFKKLQDIRLAGTAVTPEGIATLKRWFPTATVLTGSPVPPRRTVPPVRSSLPGDTANLYGRVRTSRDATPGPKKITLPDEPNREYVEVVAETAKVKIGNEVVGNVQRGDRLPVLRREGPWVGVLLSRSEGDCLGWVLGNRVRSIMPAGFETQSAAPGSPETISVSIDHTQFGGSNPTKICFELTLVNTSSQPLSFDSSAVRLVVGSETLVAVERDEPDFSPPGRVPLSRPLSLSVPEKDRRPSMRRWSDVPHWEPETVLKPGEERSAWLAFVVPGSLYPSPGSYPPRPIGYPLRPGGYPLSQSGLPGQSSSMDLAVPPWKLSIPLGGDTTEVDLVELERRVAIQTRTASSDPAVTVIEFGPRISGLSIGRVLETYEDLWAKKARCVVLFKSPYLLIDGVARARLQMASLQNGWQQVSSVWVNLPSEISTAGGIYSGGTDQVLSGGHVRLAGSEAEAVAQLPEPAPTGQPEETKRAESPWKNPADATADLRGDLHPPEVVETLIAAMGNPDTSVQVAALNAIAASLSGDSRGDRLDALRVRKPSVLESELFDRVLAATTAEASMVRYSALRSLRYCQDPRVAPLILKAFKDLEPSVRTAAAEGAAKVFAGPTADVLPLLLEQTKDTNEHAALAACQTLAQFKKDECIPRLKELQGSKNSFVARSAIDALKEIGTLTEVEAATLKLDQVLGMLSAADRQVLIVSKDPGAVAKLSELASKEPGEYTAELAACLLAEMGQPAALDPLLKRLVPGERITPQVPLALAELGDPRAIGPLKQALERSYGSTRFAVIEAMLTLKVAGTHDRTVAEIQRSPDAEQTGGLLWALRRGEADAALSLIEPFLDNERWHSAAAAILWDLGSPAATAALERKLSGADYRYGADVVEWVLKSAAQIAGTSDDAGRLAQIEKINAFLSGLAASKNDAVRAAAAEWLRDIAGQESEAKP